MFISVWIQVSFDFRFGFDVRAHWCWLHIYCWFFFTSFPFVSVYSSTVWVFFRCLLFREQNACKYQQKDVVLEISRLWPKKQTKKQPERIYSGFWNFSQVSKQNNDYEYFWQICKPFDIFGFFVQRKKKQSLRLSAMIIFYLTLLYIKDVVEKLQIFCL